MNVNIEKVPFHNEIRQFVLFKAEEIQGMEFDSRTCLMNHVAGFLGCSMPRVSQMKTDGKIHEYSSTSGKFKMMFMDTSIFDGKIKKISENLVPKDILVPMSAFMSLFLRENGDVKKTYKMKIGTRSLNLSVDVNPLKKMTEEEFFLSCVLSTFQKSFSDSGIDLSVTQFPFEEVVSMMKIKSSSSIVMSNGMTVPPSVGRLILKNIPRTGEPIRSISFSCKEDRSLNRSFSNPLLMKMDDGIFFLNSAVFEIENLTYGNYMRIPINILSDRMRTLDEIMVRFEVLRRIFLTKISHGKISSGIVYDWWKSKVSCPPGGRWVEKIFEDAIEQDLIQDVRWSIDEAMGNKKKSFVHWKDKKKSSMKSTKGERNDKGED